MYSIGRELLLVTGNKVYGFSNDCSNGHSPTRMRNLFHHHIQSTCGSVSCNSTTEPIRYAL